MLNFRKIFLPLLAILASISATATDVPLITAPTTISSGSTQQFNICSLSKNQTITITIESRLPSASFGGSTSAIKLTVNDLPVNAVVSRTVGRLRNKPLSSPIGTGWIYTWFNAQSGWRVIYSPDSTYSSYPSFYTPSPYILEFDVSDLINDPPAGNVIKLTNSHPNADLEINSMKYSTSAYGSPSPIIAAAASMEPEENNGTPGAVPASYTCSVLAGGGFTVTTGSTTWSFTSDLSYPNSGYNKLVPLSSQDTSGETNWTVSKNGNTITASGAYYSITRTFEFTSEKITISDAITNNGSSAIGMVLNHHVNLAGMTNPYVSLGGNPDPRVDYTFSAPNPTVHIAASDHGIGMVLEDEVSRVHDNLYFYPEDPTSPTSPPSVCYAGFEDQMLRIPASSTYTNVWSVYPVSSRDYYDFINLVRQEKGANFPVQGGYCWFDANDILSTSANTINNLLTHNGVKYAFVTGGLRDTATDPMRIGFGMAIADSYWSTYRSTIRSAATLIRQANSEFKVGIYYNSLRDTSDTDYTDSWLTRSDGTHDYTTWTYNFYPTTYNMVATSTNSFGSALIGLINNCIMASTSGGDPAMGLDGIYWDEMEAQIETYNILDGNSCIIDMSTFTIDDECGFVPLLSKQHNQNTINAVKNNGGFLLANTAPYSNDLLNTNVPRFAEVHPGAGYEYKAHLGSPLGFIIYNDFTFAEIIEDVLEHGCLPVWPYWDYTQFDFFRYMWPVTVMEMYSGYFLARERIIIAHAGTYGWRAGNSLVQVRHFDTSGTLKTTLDSYQTTIPGSNTAISSLTSGEAVILERIPVTIDPRP